MSIMSRLSRTKKHKTHNYKCQMEEPGAKEALSTVDEFADGSVSPESESHGHTHWHVEEFAGEKIDTWRRVDHWLMSGFLPVSRSGPCAPSGGVAGRRWSSCRKIFPATEVV